MRTSCVKNGLVACVILLFVGVAVQPVIIADVSIESDDSELVEITVEICEVDNVYNHAVMLTQEQAEELENLINNFEIELENADDLDETEAIFRDTVVSLNDLGLLPKDMSVEKAQRLVTGKEQNPRVVKFLERWISKNKKGLSDDENFYCLIAGDTSRTYSLGPLGQIHNMILHSESFYEFTYQFYHLHKLVGILLFVTLVLGLIVWNFNPLPFGYELSLGYSYKVFNGHTNRRPSEGWVSAKSSNRIKFWSGSLWGNLPFPTFFSPNFYTCYPGIFGFTGIKIRSFYIGFALWVKIRYD